MPLIDYIQYHNVEQRGRWPFFGRPKAGIYWTANRSIPIGARVWLVAGEKDGRTKRYWIAFWIIVDELGQDGDKKTAAGAKAQRFDPAVEITDEPWFPEFRDFMGNFGRGLSPLRPQDVRNFQVAVSAATRQKIDGVRA